MAEYRILKEEEINRELFGSFIRHQIVKLCLRREEGTIPPEIYFEERLS